MGGGRWTRSGGGTASGMQMRESGWEGTRGLGGGVVGGWYEILKIE